MSEFLNEAIKWYSQGVAVIPTFKMDKKAAVPWKKYQSELPKPEELINWFSGDRYNMAVVGGWNGLIVVDFDIYDAYSAWKAIYPKIDTYTIKTGRGVHIYFYCRNQDVRGIPGAIDVKGTGGYFLAPPSIHPVTNRPYEVLIDAPIMQVENLSSVCGMLPRKETQSEQYQKPQVSFPSHTEQEPLNSLDRLDIAPVPVVDLIKSKISLLQFFKDPQPSGNGRYMVFCPFHKDGKRRGNRSMVVYSQENTCWCHAGCTPKPLDVINFYARKMNIRNRQAIQELAKRLR
jgi:hypothetical protein